MWMLHPVFTSDDVIRSNFQETSQREIGTSRITSSISASRCLAFGCILPSYLSACSAISGLGSPSLRRILANLP